MGGAYPRADAAAAGDGVRGLRVVEVLALDGDPDGTAVAATVVDLSSFDVRLWFWSGVRRGDVLLITGSSVNAVVPC